MDPKVINILVRLGVIYGVSTLLRMVAVVRSAHNILQAATNSVNAVEGLRGDIRDKGSVPTFRGTPTIKDFPIDPIEIEG